MPRRSQFVVQRLRQQVSDLALAGGAADVERLTVRDVRGPLGAQQLRADLRPVAVRNHEVIPEPDQAQNGRGGPASVRQLLGDRSLFACSNQRVAANRN